MRFLRGIFTDNREGHLPGLHVLQPFAAGDQFAIGREDRRDQHDVARRNSRVAQRQLKARKPSPMFTDAFGEVSLLSDKRHGPAGRASVVGLTQKNFRCEKVTRSYCSVNAIPARCASVYAPKIYSAADFTFSRP